ncbi:MAG: trimethylamine methyltransferase family protein [Ardenticatenaceae bacterium]|nr:trimethylamine methyltransferase family protein [Ardenticatenaceae bacterium]
MGAGCPARHSGPTRHLHRLLAGFELSDKAVMEAAHGRIITSRLPENGQKSSFGSLEGDPVIGDVINVNSPLRFDERMLGGLLTYARAGQVTFITCSSGRGDEPGDDGRRPGPANAEALAGIALTQLVRPAHR